MMTSMLGKKEGHHGLVVPLKQETSATSLLCGAKTMKRKASLWRQHIFSGIPGQASSPKAIKLFAQL